MGSVYKGAFHMSECCDAYLELLPTGTVWPSLSYCPLSPPPHCPPQQMEDGPKIKSSKGHMLLQTLAGPQFAI